MQAVPARALGREGRERVWLITKPKEQTLQSEREADVEKLGDLPLTLIPPVIISKGEERLV